MSPPPFPKAAAARTEKTPLNTPLVCSETVLPQRFPNPNGNVHHREQVAQHCSTGSIDTRKHASGGEYEKIRSTIDGSWYNNKSRLIKHSLELREVESRRIYCCEAANAKCTPAVVSLSYRQYFDHRSKVFKSMTSCRTTGTALLLFSTTRFSRNSEPFSSSSLRSNEDEQVCSHRLDSIVSKFCSGEHFRSIVIFHGDARTAICLIFYDAEM